MCVSWWEGKLRLQNKKGLLRAFTRLETFSPHFHSFLLPSSSHSTGGYTNKPVLGWSSSTSTIGEFWPQILLVKHFVFHQVKKKLLFLQTQLRVLPRVKMSICWNLAESKISSFPGPDRFYPVQCHITTWTNFCFQKTSQKIVAEVGNGVYSRGNSDYTRRAFCLLSQIWSWKCFCYSKNKWL